MKNADYLAREAIFVKYAVNRANIEAEGGYKIVFAYYHIEALQCYGNLKLKKESRWEGPDGFF